MKEEGPSIKLHREYWRLFIVPELQAEEFGPYKRYKCSEHNHHRAIDSDQLGFVDDGSDESQSMLDMKDEQLVPLLEPVAFAPLL